LPVNIAATLPAADLFERVLGVNEFFRIRRLLADGPYPLDSISR
jgi:hypothetical protein